MKYIIIIYLLYREHSTAFDAVHVYALDILNLGLIYKGFHDAVKEGDGDRVIRYWKVLMVLFKETGKRNYSKEAFLLILQLHSLSERAATEVKWSRFVNRRGQIGCNIPCDLAMEHLNRRLKGIIRNMGANVVPSALARAAKSIGSVDCVCDLFEQSVMAQQTSSKHTIAQDSKDFQLVLQILNEKKIFKEEIGRHHSRFRYSCTLLEQSRKETLCTWLQKLLQEHIGFVPEDDDNDDDDDDDVDVHFNDTE